MNQTEKLVYIATDESAYTISPRDTKEEIKEQIIQRFQYRANETKLPTKTMYTLYHIPVDIAEQIKDSHSRKYEGLFNNLDSIEHVWITINPKYD